MARLLITAVAMETPGAEAAPRRPRLPLMDQHILRRRATLTQNRTGYRNKYLLMKRRKDEELMIMIVREVWRHLLII